MINRKPSSLCLLQSSVATARSIGGIPTTKPEPINVGKTLKEMVAQDVKDELNAIKMYKGIIDQARKEKDETTKFLFLSILKDEEEHHDTFTTLFEQI